MAVKRDLGKGLNSGKGVNAFFPEPQSPPAQPAADGETVIELKIMDIEPNTGQPRKSFDDEALGELAQSIQEHGVLTPILVHKSENGFYKIIAGERRWRASKLAGQKTIPAIVKDFDEIKVHEVALIENLQRQDLNPVEEALGYKQLMDDYSLTQEKISQRLGKSRSSIANALRLLTLSKEALELLANGDISTGHAKVLAGLPDQKLQTTLAQQVAQNKLSVRELEALIKQSAKKPKQKKPEDLNLKLAFETIEKRIADSLATKVKIVNNNGKGKITIDYYSTEDLERITKLLENGGN
ncbi:MAG: ParB/RepB/Spo0J family partition protein [Clostridia bacterium]|nr:ParB/RepB/Spo0J family partition protein [Clostridia bacterium]